LALGINDGGLRVAHMMCGYKGGSFEMWSQMCSESASTAAWAGSLGCMQWWDAVVGMGGTGSRASGNRSGEQTDGAVGHAVGRQLLALPVV